MGVRGVLHVEGKPKPDSIDAQLFLDAAKSDLGDIAFAAKTWRLTFSSPGIKLSEAALSFTYTDDDVNELMEEHLSVYRKNGDRWEKLGSTVDLMQNQISVRTAASGEFTLGAKKRLLWTFMADGALLCSPAISDLDHDGAPEIILDSRNIDRKVYAIDRNGQKLWEFETGGIAYWTVISDIENDGEKEIVVGSSDCHLYVLDASGKLKWNYKFDAQAFMPAAGDIDGDGENEIVISTYDGVYAFSCAGDVRWRYPSGFRTYVPVLADVDNDGRLEVLVGEKDGQFHVINSDGSLRWKKQMGGYIESCALAIDFDGDGSKEILLQSRDSRLTCFDANGAKKWILPVSRNNDWSPVAADWDGDGVPEVLYQDAGDCAIVVADGEGRIMQKIPIGGPYAITPVVADMNGDSLPDVITQINLGWSKRFFVAYDHSGAKLWSFQTDSWAKYGGSPALADLNGDGHLEILFGTDGTVLYALSTAAPCAPYQIVNGMFRGDAQHSGIY
ncbi:PQQ-like beta-propeller repeat protein [candidate division KSB1 bacterium]|nr:PQQ-like beta-propeller repeat protein [candidate division KSB1 bacterium]